MALFLVALWQSWNFTIICIIMAFLGFFLVPVMPLSFELACELSFPIGEAIAAGMLVTGGQLSGTVLVRVIYL
jgi:FLVCR family MFS transporter 7